MLRLDRHAFDAICSLAYREYPLEMCGLIAGPTSPTPAGDGGGPEPAAGADAALAVRFYPCRNLAASAKLYTIDPADHLKAEFDADDRGWEIIGVVHSHTHSEPFPSPTDVAQAPDATWHYVIVSLKRDAPELRSYRIVGSTIREEPVVLVDGVSSLGRLGAVDPAGSDVRT